VIQRSDKLGWCQLALVVSGTLLLSDDDWSKLEMEGFSRSLLSSMCPSSFRVWWSLLWHCSSTNWSATPSCSGYLSMSRPPVSQQCVSSSHTVVMGMPSQ